MVYNSSRSYETTERIGIAMSGNNEHLGSAANGGGEAVGSPEERHNTVAHEEIGVFAVWAALRARYEAVVQEQGRKAFAEFAKLLTPGTLADDYREAMATEERSIVEKQSRLSCMDLSFFGVTRTRPVANDMVNKLIDAGILVPISEDGDYEYGLNSKNEKARELLTSVQENCRRLDQNAETSLKKLTVNRITKTTQNAEGRDVETYSFRLRVNFLLSGLMVEEVKAMQARIEEVERRA